MSRKASRCNGSVGGCPQLADAPISSAIWRPPEIGRLYLFAADPRSCCTLASVSRPIAAFALHARRSAGVRHPYAVDAASRAILPHITPNRRSSAQLVLDMEPRGSPFAPMRRSCDTALARSRRRAVAAQNGALSRLFAIRSETFSTPLAYSRTRAHHPRRVSQAIAAPFSRGGKSGLQGHGAR